MKKTIYIAAALMALAGCSKSEIAPEATTGAHDIAVSVKVSDGGTKAESGRVQAEWGLPA